VPDKPKQRNRAKRIKKSAIQSHATSHHRDRIRKSFRPSPKVSARTHLSFHSLNRLHATKSLLVFIVDNPDMPKRDRKTVSEEERSGRVLKRQKRTRTHEKRQQEKSSSSSCSSDSRSSSCSPSSSHHSEHPQHRHQRHHHHHHRRSRCHCDKNIIVLKINCCDPCDPTRRCDKKQLLAAIDAALSNVGGATSEQIQAIITLGTAYVACRTAEGFADASDTVAVQRLLDYWAKVGPVWDSIAEWLAKIAQCALLRKGTDNDDCCVAN
jgi:hypothetical protein